MECPQFPPKFPCELKLKQAGNPGLVPESRQKNKIMTRYISRKFIHSCSFLCIVSRAGSRKGPGGGGGGEGAGTPQPRKSICKSLYFKGKGASFLLQKCINVNSSGHTNCLTLHACCQL